MKKIQMINNDWNLIFLRRALSFFLDMVFIGLINVLLALLMHYALYPINELVNISACNFHMICSLICAPFMIIEILYFVITIAKYSATLGQRMMSLELKKNNGRPLEPLDSVFRVVAINISLLTFSFGYLIAMIRKDNKTIIDILSFSNVVDINSHRLRKRDQI